ncbi:MAG: cation-translocating P-type ATPase [Thermomicrobiales bacterium]
MSTATATAPSRMPSDAGSLVFDVTGMDCGDCARSVERIVGQLPGIESASVSFGAGTLTVEPTTASGSGEDLVRAVGGAVDRAGYAAVLRTAGRQRGTEAPWWQSRRVIPTAIALALWIVAFVAHHALDARPAAIGLFAVAIVIGGYPILRSAIAAIRARRIDMNVLMTISVIGAAMLGDWSEGALVVVLFSLGTFLQAMTLDRTRRAIRSLLDLTPEEAIAVRNGVEVTVAASTLVVDDIVRVRPGQRLPADGTIVSGHSAINQAAITGESMPVEKAPGQEVFAGTINGSGVLDVRVTAPSSQSMLATIVHLVEEAQASRAPSQQLVDRFAAIYTPLVVAGAVLLALGGWLLSGDPATWTYRALVLLVIACPCALVISTPVSIVSAIQGATKMGVLVKGGAALEELAKVRAMVFDKTGTLTVGRPVVSTIEPFGDAADADVLAFAAAVEAPSEHPLARAVVARALHDRVTIPTVDAFAALTGRGAQGTVDGHTVLVGSPRLMRESHAPADQLARLDAIAARHAESGQTTLAVATMASDTATIVGAIAVADRLRPGAAEALAALRRAGVERLVMLTGDQRGVAEAIAGAVGVDEVRAELLPSQKSSALDEIRAASGAIAMVGDGVNDAPALAKADVGIAMGIGGSDVALESASMALMRDDLSAIAQTVALSKRMVRIVQQNVTLSLLTKALALGLAMAGFVNLWIAVVVDVGTSLVVILNGIRLSRIALADDAAPAVVPMAASTAHVHDAPCECGGPHEHAHRSDGSEHDHSACACGSKHDHVHEASPTPAA